MKTQKTRNEILQEFEQAPLTTLFDQRIPAAVLGCSCSLMERNRWQGGGVPFLKIGRSVRYRKTDILAWLERHTPVNSTSMVSAAQG